MFVIKEITLVDSLKRNKTPGTGLNLRGNPCPLIPEKEYVCQQGFKTDGIMSPCLIETTSGEAEFIPRLKERAD